MYMHGLKQLLVLALAGSGLACQCTLYGQKGAQVDIKATEQACPSSGGHIVNPGRKDIQEPAMRLFTTVVLDLLGSSVQFRDSRLIVDMTVLSVDGCQLELGWEYQI
ncbi:hypothetical protein Vi05172_g12464 [Venturia inaequalis]|nr:hypothetical protein Vi05172_g12464 [Venturia inaequalis]